jgi:hypothetical protein
MMQLTDVVGLNKSTDASTLRDSLVGIQKWLHTIQI